MGDHLGVDMVEHDSSCFRPDGRPLPRDVKTAVDYMRENIGRPVRIADLVAATRAPERTLHKHFRRFFGLPPLGYFRRLRFGAAREALLASSGDSVTEIAAQFGFAHLGRFSSDYRRCFGELPSTTRHRATLLRQVDDPSSPGVMPAPYNSGAVPTLVIVPFQTAGDRESADLAGSLSDLIAIGLARGRALSVRLVPGANGVAKRRLSARYCLMGRVSRASGRARVVVRLIDAEEDRHLWGDSFDAVAGDELCLQDIVVAEILRDVQPRILADQIERAQRADPGALTGIEMALRALPMALAPNKAGQLPDSSGQVVDLLHDAMMLAPDCALVVALMGWCRARKGLLAWNTAAEERTEAERMADQAAMLAPTDPMVLAIRASIMHLAGAFEAAESLATRSIAIDPTCAWGWDRLGWVCEATHRPDAALPYFARAERIPVPYLDAAANLDGVGTAHFCAGRYRGAATILRTAALMRPGSTGLHGKLAACYVQIGEKAAARAELAKLRRILPDVSAEQYANSYPCGPGPFRQVLANSLIEIGMRG